MSVDPETKLRVIRLFLEFAQRFIALNKAVCATLGGEGREAKIWSELGVEHENGWLIERQKKLSRTLIREHRYRYVSSLGSFAHVIKSIHDKEARVDVFHLDLCGTIESVTSVFAPVMPLIVQSKGRCLAITVADQRRNLSVERFPKIRKELERLLGPKLYREFYDQLLNQLGNGRTMAVEQELGFFLQILGLFKLTEGYAVPDEIKRYVYISRSSRYPFRMRSYFFHFFKGNSSMTHRQFAKQLYRYWIAAPVSDFTGIQKEKNSMAQKATGGKYERLAALAQAAGGEVLQQFTQLLADVSDTVAGMVPISAIRAYLDKLEGGQGPKRRREESSVEAPAPARRKGGHRSAKPAKPTRQRRPKVALAGKPQKGEWVLALLDLLKKRASGNGAYKKAQEETALRFFGRKKNRRRALGSMAAHSVGKYRPEFLKKVAKSHPERINEDLAFLYSKIERQEVTVDQLRSEAGL